MRPLPPAATEAAELLASKLETIGVATIHQPKRTDQHLPRAPRCENVTHRFMPQMSSTATSPRPA